MKILKGKNFHGGVHLKDFKALSKNAPIEILQEPDEVAICLGQHIGKPATALVAVGDTVYQGQMIGKANGYISAHIFSSVSGTVTAISTKKDERNNLADYIIIKNDHADNFQPLPSLEEYTKENIIQRIEESGIVGLGGAAFPTAVKINPTAKVDCLIINGAECEPYLTCDYRLMKEKINEVVKGIHFLATALNVTKIYVGIENNKSDCIEAFSKFDELQVVRLKERYPMGGEKQLIYACTKRKVPCGKLPADIGCVVQNIATAYSIYEAVECNKPLYERVITVSGDGIKEPKNLLVKNGTPFRFILEHCGIKEDAIKFINGGPMMGYSFANMDAVTKKATSGLLALSLQSTDVKEPTACINCGKCAAACPMHLMPMDIDFYTQIGDYEMARDMGGVLNCIECGACAYSCPARRPIVQSVVLAKSRLRQMSMKK